MIDLFSNTVDGLFKRMWWALLILFIMAIISTIISGYIWDWDWRCIITDRCVIIK